MNQNNAEIMNKKKKKVFSFFLQGHILLRYPEKVNDNQLDVKLIIFGHKLIKE